MIYHYDFVFFSERSEFPYPIINVYTRSHAANCRLGSGVGLWWWCCVLADLLPEHYLFWNNNRHKIIAVLFIGIAWLTNEDEYWKLRWNISNYNSRDNIKLFEGVVSRKYYINQKKQTTSNYEIIPDLNLFYPQSGARLQILMNQVQASRLYR